MPKLINYRVDTYLNFVSGWTQQNYSITLAKEISLSFPHTVTPWKSLFFTSYLVASYQLRSFYSLLSPIHPHQSHYYPYLKESTCTRHLLSSPLLSSQLPILSPALHPAPCEFQLRTWTSIWKRSMWILSSPYPLSIYFTI
jgi:hypothetical protein